MSVQIAVDGDNFFHTGWLACFLGLPRRYPGQEALKDAEVAAFKDGWDTCHETPRQDRHDTFLRLIVHKQVATRWIDYEGEDVT